MIDLEDGIMSYIRRLNLELDRLSKGQQTREIAGRMVQIDMTILELENILEETY